MSNKLFYTLLLAILLPLFSSAQDPHFTQYFANPLYLNPAFAGTVVCPRLTLNYRNQWASMPGYYNSYTLGYDFHRDNLSGGIGLLAIADRQAGIISNYSLGAMYAYNIAASPKFNFKASIEARVFQKSINWSELYFGDQIDPKYGFIFNTNELTPDKQSKIAPDFNFGILGYSNMFFIGAAVHHLTQPDEGFITKTHLPRKYTAHAGAIFNLLGTKRKKRLDDPMLSPNFIYQNQRGLEQLNYGIYFSKYPITFGVWYRQSLHNADALTLLLGLQANVFKIGYSYDVTVSKLSYSTGGAHELSCGIKLPCRPAQKKPRVINCPTF